jgi:hypothetical protein
VIHASPLGLALSAHTSGWHWHMICDWQKCSEALLVRDPRATEGHCWRSSFEGMVCLWPPPLQGSRQT